MLVVGGGIALKTGKMLLVKSLANSKIGHPAFRNGVRGTWNTGARRFGWSGRNGSDTYYLQFRNGGARSRHIPPEGLTIKVTAPRSSRL